MFSRNKNRTKQEIKEKKLNKSFLNAHPSMSDHALNIVRIFLKDFTACSVDREATFIKNVSSMFFFCVRDLMETIVRFYYFCDEE